MTFSGFFDKHEAWFFWTAIAFIGVDAYLLTGAVIELVSLL